MQRDNFRRARLMCSAAAVALVMPALAHAEAANFNIPAQSLGSALKEFSLQSQYSLVAPPDIVDAKTTAGVTQSAEPEIALAQLLQGTGLSYRRDGDTFLIVRASDPQSGSAAGDGAEGTVQALIVTAQKREENIQDVPIAMSAFTQEDLTRSQVTGGPDLMTQVPNFTFTKTNFTGYSIQIRGIGTQAISATTDAAVAVAFNNTPFIRNRFFEQEFYDLQRVEVLRGPQGTLYGRNATAGVVNLISQKPKFTYESRLSLDIGNYNSHRLEGMLNIPLVDDKVALRIAGAWTKRDGYDLNQITGNRIDGRDLWSTRLSLRFAPTDKLDLNLIWEHFNENDDRLRSGKQLCNQHMPETIGGLTVPYATNGYLDGIPGNNNGELYQTYFSQGCQAASLYSPDSFQTPNGLRLPYYRPAAGVGVPIRQLGDDGLPFDPYASVSQSHDLRVIESTVSPVYRAKTDLAELQASYDLTGSLTLISETAYLRDFIYSSEDYNRFNTRPGAFTPYRLNGSYNDAYQLGVIDINGVFCDPQIGCSDRLVAVDLSKAQSTQFSEELRLASNFDGPFNFSLGGNFLRYDTEDKYYVFINTLSLGAASMSNQPYQGGVSTNTQCLTEGMVPPDPNGISSLPGCVYIDPNPINNVNDLGHNYFLSRNPYKLISYAVFGEAYYKLTEAVKITAGLRWTVDKKEAPRIPSWILASGSVGYPVAEVIEQEWREPTGRMAVDWKPQLSFTDETLVYGSYAHGYKAGGANPPANGLVLWDAGQGEDKAQYALLAAAQAAVAPRTFKPEFVDAFELGTKNTLLDGRVTLNAAGFYYDYRGYQISQIVNRSAINMNFDANVWGLELESDWRPVENLRIGLKLGYEDTKMAKGSKAVDIMDRTAGHTDWYVTGPFPTLAANCVLPTYTVVHPNGQLAVLGQASGGGLGPCEYAYILGYDPVTNQPYQSPPVYGGNTPDGYWYDGYPGFDPLAGTPGDPYTSQNTYNNHDYGPVPNGGAGFYKNLSGHELPNAPHVTATLTADYTVPLPNNWLATLHGDFYYQSEAWARVFNTPGYDKLKAYTNVNLAAIFSNEDAGWKIMAYVKNVLDHDSITGAFLNSDDTGLTTNVFLNEPRLYGLRITKEWTGEGWWTGANPNHVGPYPLTIEFGGQVQHHEAPRDAVRAETFADAPDSLDPSPLAQGRRLDWGDGRSLVLTYRPTGDWLVSASVRSAETNNGTTREHRDILTVLDRCAFPANSFLYNLACVPGAPFYDVFPQFRSAPVRESMDAAARDKEENLVADLQVGHDLFAGGLLADSNIKLGLRYADLKSLTQLTTVGLGDWNIPDGFQFLPSSYSFTTANVEANRRFTGAGPSLAFSTKHTLAGGEDTGRVALDFGLGGAALFGKQKTVMAETDVTHTYQGIFLLMPQVTTEVGNGVTSTSSRSRSKTVIVPTVDASLGLSYDVGRIAISAGYRWERYFNALDVGANEHRNADRTIDGPYFKFAVGFGG